MADNAAPFNVSIIIFRAEPLDYQMYRHASICFRSDDQRSVLVVHIVGPNMGYEFQAREDYEPCSETNFAKEVTVGTLRTATSTARLSLAVQTVPIDNSTQEFNCQLWVGHALRLLVQRGLLGSDEVTRGISDMVDATMEATDG